MVAHLAWVGMFRASQYSTLRILNTVSCHADLETLVYLSTIVSACRAGKVLGYIPRYHRVAYLHSG